jgi:hypothetical protein
MVGWLICTSHAALYRPDALPVAVPTPCVDRSHPWAEVVAAAVRIVDAGKAGEDLTRAVREMQDAAYGTV